jgi:hypothetical protein
MDRAAAVLYSLDLRSTSGDGANSPASWRVTVHPVEDGKVNRSVWLRPEPEAENTGSTDDFGYVAWKGDGAWTPELNIWPSWHRHYHAAEGESAVPLEMVTQHCRRNGERLRESAKWMATIVGVALAALIGTSPLADMREAEPSWVTLALGVAGLLLLGVTLWLILAVIRPQPVSYRDIQAAPRGPLRKWREMVESEQDLYLPCGVRCLTTLRQTMIVDELTLNVLAGAINQRDMDADDRQRLEKALKGRVARLMELRQAASQVVAVADYYKLRRRSTHATYLGGLCAITATAAIVAAFLIS